MQPPSKHTIWSTIGPLTKRHYNGTLAGGPTVIHFYVFTEHPTSDLYYTLKPGETNQVDHACNGKCS